MGQLRPLFMVARDAKSIKQQSFTEILRSAPLPTTLYFGFIKVNLRYIFYNKKRQKSFATLLTPRGWPKW
jgi:hypothetical protein